MRRWRQQWEELIQCQKTRKAFRGNKSRWPELEDVLEDWVSTREQAAGVYPLCRSGCGFSARENEANSIVGQLHFNRGRNAGRKGDSGLVFSVFSVQEEEK